MLDELLSSERSHDHERIFFNALLAYSHTNNNHMCATNVCKTQEEYFSYICAYIPVLHSYIHMHTFVRRFSIVNRLYSRWNNECHVELWVVAHYFFGAELAYLECVGARKRAFYLFSSMCGNADCLWKPVYALISIHRMNIKKVSPSRPSWIWAAISENMFMQICLGNVWISLSLCVMCVCLLTQCFTTTPAPPAQT